LGGAMAKLANRGWAVSDGAAKLMNEPVMGREWLAEAVRLCSACRAPDLVPSCRRTTVCERWRAWQQPALPAGLKVLELRIPQSVVHQLWVQQLELPLAVRREIQPHDWIFYLLDSAYIRFEMNKLRNSAGNQYLDDSTLIIDLSKIKAIFLQVSDNW
jgi:hypothetical protein